MKTALKKLLLSIFILFLVIGCKKDTSPPRFTKFAIDQVSDLNCNPEEENCAYISINIPWAENSGIRNKSINNQIEQQVIQLVDYQEENHTTSLESLAQNFIDHYEASAAEFPEYNIPWEASVGGEVLSNTEEIISLKFELALFTGGAHGYTSVSFLNFDPETGDLMRNEDLFTPDFKDYAEKIFREKQSIPAGAPINSTGYFFENDEFVLPQNIGFFKNRVILRYNTYEIASYAEGGILIELPREEVEEFLNLR